MYKDRTCCTAATVLVENARDVSMFFFLYCFAEEEDELYA